MADTQVQYSKETLDAMREAFKSKDVDDNGTLDPDELVECLELVGLCATEEDIDFLIKHFDTNGDGLLQIEELVENMSIINSHVLYREDLMEAFVMFDSTGDGYIRLPELNKILTLNGFMKPEEAGKLLNHLIEKYDKNHDGKFNYAEFVDIFVAKELDPDKIENHRQRVMEKAAEARKKRRCKKKQPETNHDETE